MQWKTGLFFLPLLGVLGLLIYDSFKPPSQITECDQLAAAPNDHHAVTEGVPFGAIQIDQAYEACQKATEEFPNEPRLMFQYGRVFLKDKQYTDAKDWYFKAANLGYLAAQNNLGVMYQNGDGVPRDDEEAIKWYQKAAEQEDAHAQYNLGWMYEHGRGVSKDNDLADRWFKKAARQGHTQAQYTLGLNNAQKYVSSQEQKKSSAATMKEQETSWIGKKVEKGLIFLGFYPGDVKRYFEQIEFE